MAENGRFTVLYVIASMQIRKEGANSECLQATHHEPDIMPLADKQIKLWLGPRGHPENVGGEFEATQ